MTNALRMSASQTAQSEYARQTRERILAAAEARFRHYGYTKTSMVDIAGDCAMSHANLYRFFRNKADLVDAIAAQWLASSEELCRSVATRKTPARRRIVDFVIELHRWKRTAYANSAGAYEMLTMASVQMRPFIGVHLETLRDILAGIIEDGNARREFKVKNPRLLAEIIQNATIKFCDPRLVAQFSEQPLEAQARALIRVLLDGAEAV